jgi:myo-inositol-1(or 4)-monophosphatase
VTYDLQEDAALARDAARRAGVVILRHFGTSMKVRHKEPGQPLTIADLEADALLKELLHDERPGYGWLSEETEDSEDRLQRSRVWIVDPIDGTRSFIAQRPEFAVSIGLAVDGVAVVGVVYNPARDELFWAVRGGGAVLEVGGGRIPLKVARRETSDDLVVVASRSDMAAGDFAAIAGDWRIEGVGSTAYKLARVAWGRGDVFLSRGRKKEWDVCAGALLVEEAGGRVTDVAGTALHYNREDPGLRGVVAAHADLHAQIVRRIGDAAWDRETAGKVER